MPDQLTTLDIQFIKASLSTRTDQEIADVLEVPAETVRSAIRDITNGDANNRSAQIEQARAERQLATEQVKAARLRQRQEEARIRQEQKQRARAEKNAERLASQKRTKTDLAAKEKAERRKRENQAVINRNEAHRVQSRRREEQRRYPTRVIDWSRHRSYRIDEKTTIFLPVDMNDRQREKYILQYKEREASRIGKIKNDKS